jgi:tetratricopeptide (TPR) repeat protein
MYANNSWVAQNDSSTLFAFVHGVLSSSETCWRNAENGAYWPELVARDPALNSPAVFVSGYPSTLGSGPIDVIDAAEVVMRDLRAAGQASAPLARSRLVFVCHSQGGIVVRQLLVSFADEFRAKQIGIVLCASPSWGSLIGTLAAPITRLLGFKQGYQLRWGSDSLIGLDRAFVRLLNKKTFAQLSGMCLVETRGFLPMLPVLVIEAAATRYFVWHRIPRATHGSLVKPTSTSEESHRWLVDFVLNAQLVDAPSPEAFESSGPAAGAPPSLPSEVESPPTDDFAPHVEHYFVGRSRFRQDVTELLQRLDRCEGGAYWIHGYGGMGKSFFLRRVYIDTPPHLQRCLVDWDDCTDQYRAPLRDRPRSIADLCDALAYAFSKALTRSAFGDYFAASTAVRRHEPRRTLYERRFDAAIEELYSILEKQRPEAFPQSSTDVPDYIATEEEQRRRADREALLAIVSEEPTVRAARRQLDSLRRGQPAFFDFAAWEAILVRWIHTIAEVEPESVSDPVRHLLSRLAAPVIENFGSRGCVLLLDTHEVLSPRLDWYLMRLLSSFVQRGTRLLTIIAGRYEPDARLPNPGFAGWQESLREHLKVQQFSSTNVRFTRTDIEELLQRSRRPVETTPALIEGIQRITLGVPMAVAMILSMHEQGDEVLSTLAEWDYTDPTQSVDVIAQRIIGEVARRFLLHIEVRRNDQESVRDVVLLALVEGGWVEDLQRLWWGGASQRTERLLYLTRQIDFIDGGSLHEVPRSYFRTLWKTQPHRFLSSVIASATSLMEQQRDAVMASRTSLHDWLMTYSSLLAWHDVKAAIDSRVQALLLRFTDPLIAEPTQELSDLSASYLSSLENTPGAAYLEASLLRLLQDFPTTKWPPAIRACWHITLARAMSSDADNQRRPDSDQRLADALNHFEAGLDIFQGDIPDRDTLIDEYIEAAASYSLDQSQPEAAQRALERLRSSGLLDRPQASQAWLNYGKLLHNLRRYDESTAAYQRAAEIDPSVATEAARYIAHNCSHQKDPRHELSILESTFDKDPESSDLAREVLDAFLIPPVNVSSVRRIVLRALDANPEDAGVLSRAGYFQLIALRGRERSARVLLMRASTRWRTWQSRDTRLASVWLLIAEWKCGNRQRAAELAQKFMRASDIEASHLNTAAWETFRCSAALDLGLAFADQALKLEPSDEHFLNTRLAVLCRRGDWDQVPTALSQWVAAVSQGELRDAWHLYRDLFGLIQRSSVAKICAEMMLGAIDADFHLLARRLRQDTALPSEFSELEETEPVSH